MYVFVYQRKKECADATRELADVHAKMTALSSQLDAVKSELNLKSSEIVSYAEKVAVLQLVADNKAFLDKRLVEVELTLTQSEMETVALKDKLALFEDKVKSQGEYIQKRDLIVANLEGVCRDLKSTIADLTRREEQEVTAKSQAAAAQALLQQRAEEVSQDLHRTAAKLTAAIAERDEATTQLSRMRIELASKHDENVNLRATTNSLRDSLTTCEASFGKLTQQNGELQCDIVALTRKTSIIESLESKAEFDAKKLFALQNECNLLCEKVEHLDKLKINNDEQIELLQSEIGQEKDKREKLIEEAVQHHHVRLFVLPLIHCTLVASP
jgi:chromosome segregation ATPase